LKEDTEDLFQQLVVLLALLAESQTVGERRGLTGPRLLSFRDWPHKFAQPNPLHLAKAQAHLAKAGSSESELTD